MLTIYFSTKSKCRRIYLTAFENNLWFLIFSSEIRCSQGINTFSQFTFYCANVVPFYLKYEVGQRHFQRLSLTYCPGITDGYFPSDFSRRYSSDDTYKKIFSKQQSLILRSRKIQSEEMNVLRVKFKFILRIKR